MTTYKEIFGKPVKFVSSDLSGDATTGEIWYNSTTGKFKSLLATGAWSAGGNLTNARSEIGSAVSAPTESALAFGGSDPAGNPSDKTEEYNGSGWSTGGALNTSRRTVQGFGTQTAGVAAGGFNAPPGAYHSVEEYNGSSWTANSAPGELGTGRYNAGCSGTLTSGAIFGGSDVSPATITATEEYDGTNWTSGGALSTGRNGLGGVGTQTASLAFGGKEPGISAKTEEYDGSSWTSVNSMNTARYLLSGGGTQTSMIAFGGTTASPAATGETGASEQYDGTTWTTSPASMATARYYAGGTGTSKDSAVVFGGNPGPGTTSLTEEYNFSTTVITASAWATGGTMPVAKRVGGCSKGGSISSSLTFGGDTLPMGAGQPQVNTTEEYDGSSWTGGGALGNNLSGGAGAGTQTAMIGATGYSFPTPWGTAGASYVANAFEYDGSSWTNVTAYPDTGVGLISFGTQTASAFGGGAQGGSPGPEANEKSKLYKEYDGTNWTTGGSTNVFHSRTQASAGTLTAGIVYGGIDSPGGNPSARGNTVEEYNGTAWTSALTAPQENSLGGGFGTQTAFLSSCGQDSPTPSSPGTTGYSLTTLVYDGTTMRTDANAATRRVYLGADGSIGASTGMICGGSTSYSTRTTATEEYSQATTASNVKTLTTS